MITINAHDEIVELNVEQTSITKWQDRLLMVSNAWNKMMCMLCFVIRA